MPLITRQQVALARQGHGGGGRQMFTAVRSNNYSAAYKLAAKLNLGLIKMISYKIEVLDTVLKYVQVSYSCEGCEDYWVQRAIEDDFTEVDIHAIAKEAAEEAQQYWDERAADTPTTLEVTTGEIKPIVLTEQPAFDSMTQSISYEWDESGDTRTKVWTVTDHSDERKAEEIRHKRAMLLQMTDAVGLEDVSMTEEMRTYRQALRDITDQETFPQSVIWPIAPLG